MCTRIVDPSKTASAKVERVRDRESGKKCSRFLRSNVHTIYISHIQKIIDQR